MGLAAWIKVKWNEWKWQIFSLPRVALLFTADNTGCARLQRRRRAQEITGQGCETYQWPHLTREVAITTVSYWRTKLATCTAEYSAVRSGRPSTALRVRYIGQTDPVSYYRGFVMAWRGRWLTKTFHFDLSTSVIRWTNKKPTVAVLYVFPARYENLLIGEFRVLYKLKDAAWLSITNCCQLIYYWL